MASVLSPLRRPLFLLGGFPAVLLALAASGDTDGPSRAAARRTKPRLVALGEKLPLSFEANRGQADPRVKFLARGRSYTLFLTATEAILVFRAAEATRVLRMKLVAANPAPGVEGLGELPGKSHYFLGNDPARWRANVPHYAKVRFQQVYPGIDLVYYGSGQSQLEYDFIVSAGADPAPIQLAFAGAHKLAVDTRGELVLGVAGEEIRFRKPLVYQEAAGQRREIAAAYVLRGRNQVSFELGPYDRRQPLIIDPVLSYSTFLGGSGNDSARAIAVDASGNTYVVGSTDSLNFPTSGALQTMPGGGTDAFVTKLNAEGSALVYSTYLGGSDFDTATGIAVDANAEAYITGETRSPNFPTTAEAFQPAFGGCVHCALGGDAFLVRLDPTGSTPVYSTYLGGSEAEAGYDIAVDTLGNGYVTGHTLSSNFPTVNSFQAASGGSFDGFIAKVNPSGSALVYSTYLGAAQDDFGYDIAVDDASNAYVTGETDSPGFPTATPLQGAPGGLFDAFVAKLNPVGSALVYSTFLGGDAHDTGMSVAVDPSGNAYITGNTSSLNFPTANPFQPSLGGSFRDAFVTKLTASGTALAYSTYLGGSGEDRGLGIAVDTAGNTYVAGNTDSPDFPTVNPFQAVPGGGTDAYVSKFNPSGAIVYSSYLGGNGDDNPGGFTRREIAVDAAGIVYVGGRTSSANFPTTEGAFQTTFGGGTDGFVVKIAPVLDLMVTKRDSLDPVAVGGTLTYTVGAHNGPTPTTGVTLTDTLPAEVSLVSATASQGTCSGTTTVTCDLGTLGSEANAFVTLTTTPTAAGTVSNTATLAGNEADPDPGNNSASVTTTLLTATSFFKGKVKDAARNPIEGAQVVALQGALVHNTATTNAEGRYTLAVGAGTYDLVASKSGFIDATRLGMSISANQTLTGLNFKLFRPSFFQGTVTQKGTSTPIQGALVEAIKNGVVVASTTTAADGTYSLQVIKGTYTLRASKAGYKTKQKLDQTIADGATKTVNIALPLL